MPPEEVAPVAPPYVVESKELEYCVLQDTEGNIIFNGPQQNKIAIRRLWSDGLYDIIEKNSNRVLMPRYNVYAESIPPCIHCGKDPYNAES